MVSQVENIQLVIFLARPSAMAPLDIWARVSDKPPEQFSTSPLGGGYVGGVLNEENILLQVQPHRIDLTVFGIPNRDGLVEIVDLDRALRTAMEAVRKIDFNHEVHRPAFVINAFELVSLRESPMKLLLERVPGLPVVANTAEAVFELRVEHASVATGETLNKILRWSTAKRNRMQPDGGGIVGEVRAVLTYIDISVPAINRIAQDHMVGAMEELVSIGVDLLHRGYDALR